MARANGMAMARGVGATERWMAMAMGEKARVMAMEREMVMVKVKENSSALKAPAECPPGRVPHLPLRSVAAAAADFAVLPAGWGEMEMARATIGLDCLPVLEHRCQNCRCPAGIWILLHCLLVVGMLHLLGSICCLPVLPAQCWFAAAMVWHSIQKLKPLDWVTPRTAPRS